MSLLSFLLAASYISKSSGLKLDELSGVEAPDFLRFAAGASELPSALARFEKAGSGSPSSPVSVV
jgi:hypothetical protein